MKPGMNHQEIIHHTDALLTKATAGSIATGSSGAVIAQYGDLTEQVRVFLTDWAIPINVALALLLGLAKLVTMYYEFQWRTKEELKKDIVFNQVQEERRQHDIDIGVKRRGSDYEIK